MNKVYVAAFTVLAAILAVAVVRPKSGATAPTPSKKTVVVELFTSEGCSSCPPADALLIKLREQGESGVEVIPLGFHVDYWNSLGWQDRFSSAAYSKRQEDYAEKMKLDGPYTPQMVVDGDTEFVGNNASRAHDVIAQAAQRNAAAQLQIMRIGDKLHVKIDSAPKTAEVMLAITEDNLASSVKSGENSGHVLRHAAVVRDFRQVGQIRDGGFESDVSLHIKQDWKRPDLRAVVFVQEKPVGKILAAGDISLAGSN